MNKPPIHLIESGRALLYELFQHRDLDALQCVQGLDPGAWPTDAQRDTADLVRDMHAAGKAVDYDAVQREMVNRHGLQRALDVDREVYGETCKGTSRPDLAANALSREHLQNHLAAATTDRDYVQVKTILEKIDMIGSDAPYPYFHPLDEPDQVPPIFKNGLPPGTVGAFIAEAGLGKSWIGLELAYALASGYETGIPSMAPTEPMNVLYLSYEDSGSIIKHRLLEIERTAELSGLRKTISDDHLCFVQSPPTLLEQHRPGGPVTTTDFYNKTVKQIKEKNFKLLVIDPWVNGAALADENDNASMARAIQILKLLAEQTGVAILLVHHSSKIGAAQPSQHSSRGASSLMSGCRWGIQIVPSMDRPAHIELHWVKTNYGLKPDPIVLERTSTGPLVEVQGEARNPMALIPACLEVLNSGCEPSRSNVINRRAEGVNLVARIQESEPWASAKLVAKALDMAMAQGLVEEVREGKKTVLRTVDLVAFDEFTVNAGVA